MNQLENLDDIARDAWAGDYESSESLSTAERLYVALASGRMRELCPSDSIIYAIQQVDSQWLEHMAVVWSSTPQPMD